MNIYIKVLAQFWFVIFAGLLICVILPGCAIMGGGPTGGKKDTTSPKIVEESPKNKSTLFSGSKITIAFDEFVVLDNAFKEVIISPTLSKMPEFSVKGKSVVINFKDLKLDSNTTYSIQFGNAIKDYHEGNILKNYRFVFSTGKFLDSLSISGHIAQALNHKPGTGYKIELYKSGKDSDIFKSRPLYYGRTDSSGGFKINYLPKGSYQLYSLNDKNDNYLIDEGEEIGYPGHYLTLGSALDLKDTIHAYPYSLNHFVFKKVQLANRLLQAKFEQVVDSVNVYSPEKKDYVSYAKWNDGKDSFTCWLTEDVPSIFIAVFKGVVRKDSLLNKSEGAKKSKFSYIVNSSNDNSNFYGSPVIIKATQPVTKVNLNMIKVYSGSILIQGLKYKFIDQSQTLIGLFFNSEEDQNYKIVIEPGALVSFFDDRMKDTVSVSAVIPGLRSFGNFEMNTITPVGNYIFQLVNENDQVIFYKDVSRETLVKIPFVNPGKYWARIIKDANKNDRWDGGDVISKTQPEEVFYYHSPINIKANWELAGLKFDLTKGPAVDKKQ